MLRPADSLLYSSRAQRRANLRAERARAVAQGARSLAGILRELLGTAWDVLLLLGLPLVYLTASYLLFDLPARWLSGREHVSVLGVLELAGAVAVNLIGLARALQQAPPVAPVSPEFARNALVAGWLAAVLFTIGDLAS